MATVAKVKKRLAPTNLTELAKLPPEVEDKGPTGPRRAPRKAAGPRYKEVLKILKNPSTKQEHSNPWVHHVKLYAKTNNVPYACALSNPNIKQGYEKGKYTQKITASAVMGVGKTTPTAKETKKRKKADEAEEHEKFLTKLGIGTKEQVKAKRITRFDDIFAKYDRAFTEAEDAKMVKDAYRSNSSKKSSKIIKKTILN